MLEQQANFEVIMPSNLGDIDIIKSMKKKIMVIDDDLEFRIGLCEILVEEGFLVSTAKDGDSALLNLYLQENLPDLILLDLIMPHKTGIEFRREQLMSNKIQKIPVVFMTGYGIVEGEQCLLKPINKSDLLNSIRSLI